MATFTLAVNRKFTGSDGKKTDYIDIVAWRGTAEFCANYFKKGQQVAVVGSIQVRTWKDKDNNNRKTTEVIADEVYFADSKKEQSQTEYTLSADFEEIETEDGELPF